MYSILIIDDEPIVKIALRSILPWEEHGFSICGTASNGLEAMSLIEKHQPDVIITDPPRAGMHQDVVDVILFAEPKRIVYVSCNPATQARDLQLLDAKYRVKAVQPVDMFPHTHHVENVVLLELKNPAEKAEE